MTIAVGDIQGCSASLQDLFSAVGADDDAHWWFCGDIVNRGPDSLAALRLVRELGDRAVSVLGNHDLHLLAVAHGIRPAHRDDTLDTVLAAPDRDDWIDWVRRRPLAHYADGHLLVHAGVLPQWSVAQTLELAAEVEAQLRGPRYVDFLATMYGNQPARWDDRLAGPDRWRCVINALTRLRFCTHDGTMEFKTKEGAGGAPAGFVPWFDVPGRKTADTPIIFGHWSTLGLTLTPTLIGIDTGCVWGGKLTAVRLHADWQQRRVWQVSCAEGAVTPHK